MSSRVHTSVMRVEYGRSLENGNIGDTNDHGDTGDTEDQERLWSHNT